MRAKCKTIASALFDVTSYNRFAPRPQFALHWVTYMFIYMCQYVRCRYVWEDQGSKYWHNIYRWHLMMYGLMSSPPNWEGFHEEQQLNLTYWHIFVYMEISCALQKLMSKVISKTKHTVYVDKDEVFLFINAWLRVTLVEEF